MSKRHKKKMLSTENGSGVQHAGIEIDYDKLAKAIVQAQEVTEHIREDRNRTEHEALIQRRKEILHEKDYSHIKCWLIRIAFSVLNEIGVMFRLFFISKENAEYFAGITPLTKILTIAMLGVIKWGFYITCAACLYGAYQGFGNFSMLTWFMGAFMFFMLARMLRIAGFEIDKMENGTELMNTAMLVMTVFTVIFAAVSTISSVMSKG